MTVRVLLACALLASVTACAVGAAGQTKAGATAGHGAEAARVASVRRFLREFVTARSRPMRPDPETGFYVGFARLGPGPKLDAVVYLQGGGWCGSGGCQMLVLAPAGPGWALVSWTLIVNPPIEALPTRCHGWRDLAVLAAGGGVTAHMAELPFNGKGYPLSPYVPPAHTIAAPAHAQIIIPASALDNEPLRIFPPR